MSVDKAKYKELQIVMDSLNVAVYVIDIETYEVLFINKYARDVFGDIEGGACWQTIQSGQSGPCPFCMSDKLVAKYGIPEGVLAWEQKNTVDQEWYEYRSQEISWGDGRSVRMQIAINITKRKEGEKALEARKVRSKALLDAIPDLVFRMDRQGVFLSYIAAKSELYAGHVDTLIGKRNRDIAPKEFADMTEAKIALTLDTGEMQTFEYQLPIPGRGVVDYEARMVKSGENEVTAIVRDVTKRNEAYEALKESEAQSRALLEAIPDLVFRLNRQGVFLNYKAENSDLHTPEVDTLIGKKHRDLVPPEFADFIDLKVGQTLNSGKTQTFEYQLPIPKRGIIDYEARMVKSGEGEVVSIVRDISEKKEAEIALEKSEKRYRSFVQNFLGIAYQGRMDFTPIFFHGAVEEITGYKEEDFLTGKPRWDQIIHKDDLPKIIKDSLKLREKPSFSCEREYRIVRKDGSECWVYEIIQSVSDESGRPSFVQGVIYDVTKRVEAEEKLRRQAITDPLTGIFNRRYFFELSERELKRSKRYGHPLSVIIFDIDHFKRVNDTYGHAVGDQALCKLTNETRLALREIDVFARYGGEEFIILLPETRLKQAHLMAERIRMMCVGTAPLAVGSSVVSITLSFGVASLDDEELSLDDLILRADTALYEAKTTGRNRVAIWHPKMENKLSR
ncbi:MAG: diguanylate cyclase [Chloroflexi bacterium]|nr:diguanylate cyclase [Chloroflexota bacterium]